MFDLKRFRKDFNIKQSDLCDVLGIEQSYLSQIENGKRPLSPQKLNMIRDKYGNSIMKYEQNISNAETVHEIFFRKSSPDFEVPLISQYAYAGYLSGFADPVYLESQPTYKVIHDHNGGNYVAFEVKGDSMDDNTRDAICHGDIVLGCELKKEYWIDRLYIPKVFIIVHRENGIVIKKVIDQDLINGTIICHSTNQSPEYRDFVLNLNDIQQMFYIKEITRKSKL